MDWRFDGLTALVSIAAGKAANPVVLAGNRANNIDDVESWDSTKELQDAQSKIREAESQLKIVTEELAEKSKNYDQLLKQVEQRQRNRRRRHNNSLDASGGGVFRNLIHPAMRS